MGCSVIGVGFRGTGRGTGRKHSDLLVGAAYAQAHDPSPAGVRIFIDLAAIYDETHGFADKPTWVRA